MVALARAGWTISAVAFLVLSAAVLHADHTGWFPAVLLVFTIAICAWRPISGLEMAAAAIPLSGYLMSQHWNTTISWAEIAACATISGLSIDAAGRPDAGRVPVPVAMPALLFGLVVCSAMVASLAVKSLTLGPAFGAEVARELTQEYFVDIAGFSGLHAGMLLLEGVLLFVLAARVTSAKYSALFRIAGATTAGAALAGMMNVARLAQAALRSDTPLAAFVKLTRTIRWNVEYTDYNAAGSYFVMALFLAVAMMAGAPRYRRQWTAAAIVIASALWLTGSRAAYVAGILAFGAALAIRWTARQSHHVFVAGAVGVAVIAGVTLVAFASPQRGNQGSSGTAIDIRLGMAAAGARMVEARPGFGVGLAEFYQRSGEFVSPKLLTEFPVSLHENAHNNFVQVAAELGLIGGVPFVWLVGAGLFVIAREARKAVDRDGPELLFITSAIASFVITWLAGHPLLIPEAAFVFWIVFGAAAGATPVVDNAASGRARWWTVAVLAVAIAATTPLRSAAMREDAALEHVGVGVSLWQISPDGIRYRSAEGQATIFVPAASSFEFSVNARTNRVIRVEMRLDGRLADIVSLAPKRWTDLRLPARRRAERSRYSPLELRVEHGDRIEIWITKVRPLIE